MGSRAQVAITWGIYLYRAISGCRYGDWEVSFSCSVNIRTIGRCCLSLIQSPCFTVPQNTLHFNYFSKKGIFSQNNSQNSLSTASAAVWNYIHYHYINDEDMYYGRMLTDHTDLTEMRKGWWWIKSFKVVNTHAYISKWWFIVFDIAVCAYCIIIRQALKKRLGMTKLVYGSLFLPQEEKRKVNQEKNKWSC